MSAVTRDAQQARAEDDGSQSWRDLGRRLPSRFLGAVLLLAAVNPAAPAGGLARQLLALVAAAFGWWAAPPLSARPVAPTARLATRLVRHRNTVLATATVLLAAIGRPPVWLAAAVTALLLGYLLHVDAGSHASLPPTPTARLAACAAAAVVLAAALVPQHQADAARPLAVLGIAVTAVSIGLTLYQRRAEQE
ncbi:hypothetical protein ACFYNO_18880 [Kitasatospora sp. NPDC006697]|uniref:hypothetical protein n=1 Tax=Kitasatospora sp. NPDC006697 TaxID=3364020 RepID=UPI0036AC5D06